MSFEANRGQTDDRVRFLSRGNGYRLFLTSTEAVFSFTDRNSQRPAQAEAVIRLRLVGANPPRGITGLEPLRATNNYFRGADPGKWTTGIPTYAKVRYEAVYPGIDLVYYGNQQQLEYDFVVAPGANPGAVRLRFAGAKGTRIAKNGDLVMRAGGREVRQRRPVAFQAIGTIRREIPAGYVLGASGDVAFSLGEYDRLLPLTIDPVLVYSTYWGGSLSTRVNAVAVDASGAAYMVGQTEDLDFPTTPGALQPTHGGITPGQCADVCDGFVTKFDAAGGVVYSTYFGGEGVDNVTAVAVDRFGAAYLAGGTTAPDFPTTPGAFTTTCRIKFMERCDAGFVAKLDPAGGNLVFSTYLETTNGGGSIFPKDLAVDEALNIFLTGSTSIGLPVTPGVLKPEPNGPGAGFAMKVNATGTALIYSTYLGGTQADQPAAIAIDRFGYAYVGGAARSPDFPTTPGAVKRTCRRVLGIETNCFIAFVMKINPAASAMVYSTFLGGDGDGIAALNGVSSEVTDIAVDRDGFVYVTGSALTADFPTTPGSLKPTTTTRDAFVAKLNRSGTALIYSTYLGGDAGDFNIGGGFDLGGGIAVDETGSAYVSGRAASNDFPMVDAVQASIGSPSIADAYVARLNPSGTALTFATYLGGSAVDFANSIELVGDNVYVAGWTRSSDFPLVNAANPAPESLTKSFLAKIAVPPSCGPEVTTEVEIFNSSFYPIFWPLTLRFVVVRNRTTAPIAGPLTFAIDDLENAVFVGSSQITRCLSPDGDPVMLVTVGTDNVLSPGESAVIGLWFFQTQLAPITYVPRVLSEKGTQ